MKAKVAAKRDEQSDKNKQITPHKIAEAVREQSLGGKDNTKHADVTNAKTQQQNKVASTEENSSKNNKKCTDQKSVDIDENGNEVLLPAGKVIKTRPF